MQVCPYAVKFTPLCEDTKVEASELALPPDVKITAVNAREHLHTRVEWQTIFRLPKTEAVVFSVRTFVKPLRRLEASPSEVRLRAPNQLDGDMTILGYHMSG